MSWNHDGACQAKSTALEYVDGLYSYALVLTCHHAEAEELVHETYVRATQARESLRADNNMKIWLFAVLRNIWLNQWRESRNAPQMVEIAKGDGSANSTEVPFNDSKMETDQVRAAIEKLPVEFREIILLREHEDLSYQEVASVLDCPVRTVMLRLGRARANLRILLSAKVEEVRFV